MRPRELATWIGAAFVLASPGCTTYPPLTYLALEKP